MTPESSSPSSRRPDAPSRAGRSLRPDPAVAERIAQLTLAARRAVEGFLAGHHRSPKRGVSVEFVERRPYVQGDDLRHLDWKAYARNDRLAIKRYEEETNLECTLVVDGSASMAYPAAPDGRDAGAGAVGTAATKYDYACQVAASIAQLVLRVRDGAALALFDQVLNRVVPASTAPAHLEPILAALVERRPEGVTDLGVALQRVAERVARPGLVVIVSDLLGDVEALSLGLGALVARRHDAIVLHVLHGDELRFPFDRLTRFEGLEETQRLLIDPLALRTGYLEALERWRVQVRGVCGRAGADYHLLDTSTPLEVALSAYLAARRTRLGRR
ncbi:MAG: DUF58 domain-containing protein [Planctomycetota bacterium]